MGYQVGFKSVDQGFVQIFGPRVLIQIFQNLSKSVSNLQTGYIYNYAFIMFAGFFILLFFFMSDIGFSSIFLDKKF